jgi:integrase
MPKDSTPRRSGSKPSPKLPRPDFPLRIHKGTGYWCKKVRGRLYYFGRVADDPAGVAALEEWEWVRDDLYAGREPRAKSDELTVRDVCNLFLDHKIALRDNGELSPRTFRGHYDTCVTMVKVFGRNRAAADLWPEDFRNLRAHLAKTRGPVALRNEMQRVRSVFKFAFDEGLIPAPVRFGQAFTKPKLDVVRRDREIHRQEHGDRMFEAHEIRAILGECGQPLRSMVLLGANCALGQSDLGGLPLRALDLDKGWLDFARVKTAVPRRIPLWPETIKAIREWLPERPKAKDPANAGLVFLTIRGARWVKCSEKTGAPKDAIGQEFDKVLRRLGLKRPRLGFYGLRRGFETIGGDTGDQVAVDAVMGHVTLGMGTVYRERLSDARLRRVVDYVRVWLFGEGPDNGTADESGQVAGVATIEPQDKGGRGDTPRLRLFAG